MQNNSCFPCLVDIVEFDLCNKLNSVVSRPNIVNYLYLVVSGMISYYGSEFKDDIYDIVLSTNYLIDDNYGFRFTHTIRDVLSKNIGEYSSNYVMSVCNIDKDDVLNDLETYRATYSLCITNVSISSIDILESLIRELNKIFLSKNNTFKYLGNNVTLRNGISYTNLKDSNIEDKKTINDVISYLQIEDILNIIKHLMDNNKVLIICLTVIVVLGIFLGAFYIMNSNNSKDISDSADLNLSDVSEDNSSEIKKAYMDSDSKPAKHYDDWQKDYETGLYDEYGDPIYRSVFSTSGGQYDPGIYEAYWSSNGPINETRIG